MRRETATSANARHECFVMDASVSVRTAETAEMDEKRQCDADWPALLLRAMSASPHLSSRSERTLLATSAAPGSMR